MAEPNAERALHELLARQPAKGWQAFVEQYTPLILGSLQRSGLRDRDEMMEVYTLVVERLAANRLARLRARRLAKGSLEGWLTVVTRNVVVDWVRSRAGRRRLFGVIQELAEADQRVFELYYWEERRVPEICGILSTASRREVSSGEVLEALERINTVLTTRHRAELLSMTLRSRAPEPMEDEEGVLRVDAPTSHWSPEEEAICKERDQRLERALARLAREDAAVMRLHIGEGLALSQVRRALRLESLSEERVLAIIGRLRELLKEGS